MADVHGDAPVTIGGTKALEMAYDAAQLTLAQQDNTLGSVRDRAIALLSAASLAVSFSASVGVISGDGTLTRTFGNVAGAGLLAVLVALGGTVIFVLWPVDFYFGPDAASILTLNAAGSSEAVIRTTIAESMVAKAGSNALAIRQKQRGLRLVATLLVVEIAVLVLAILAAS